MDGHHRLCRTQGHAPRARRLGGPRRLRRVPPILAYGRDPNFPGWPDTVQLNYANPEVHRMRIGELVAIAGKCDGVRCDMAMLLLPEIFQRTWGITPEPFWPSRQ